MAIKKNAKIAGMGGQVYSFSIQSSELPDYLAMTEGIGHGSTILVIDTGDVYMFDFELKTWGVLGG